MNEQFDWLAWWRQHWFPALLIGAATLFHGLLLAMPLPPKPDLAEIETEEEIIEITSLVAPTPTPPPPPPEEVAPPPTEAPPPDPSTPPPLAAAPPPPPGVVPPDVDTSKPLPPPPESAPEPGLATAAAPLPPPPPTDPSQQGASLLDQLRPALIADLTAGVTSHEAATRGAAPGANEAASLVAYMDSPADEWLDASRHSCFLSGGSLIPPAFAYLNVPQRRPFQLEDNFLPPILAGMNYAMEPLWPNYCDSDLIKVTDSRPGGQQPTFYMSLVGAGAGTLVVLWAENPNGGE